MFLPLALSWALHKITARCSSLNTDTPEHRLSLLTGFGRPLRFSEDSRTSNRTQRRTLWSLLAQSKTNLLATSANLNQATMKSRTVMLHISTLSCQAINIWALDAAIKRRRPRSPRRHRTSCRAITPSSREARNQHACTCGASRAPQFRSASSMRSFCKQCTHRHARSTRGSCAHDTTKRRTSAVTLITTRQSACKR